MPGKNRGAAIHLAQLAAKRLVEQGLKEVLGLAGGFPLLSMRSACHGGTVRRYRATGAARLQLGSAMLNRRRGRLCPPLPKMGKGPIAVVNGTEGEAVSYGAAGGRW